MTAHNLQHCSTHVANVEQATDADTISVGTVIDGRYRIEAVLGQGAMGCVYRAEHTGIGRTVAIKVLRAVLGGSQEAAQRFKREALASGRLDHPNIVGVSDFGVLDDGSCFLVMEALQGESLGDRIDREGPLPWTDALDVMRGVLRGLYHAHARGVVHRDIKPDNIFLAIVDGLPVVKLLDFGIAKLVAGTSEDPASTRAGMTMGTPAYLSPEQAVGGVITPATDLYSATVVLFEMLTGRTPFEDPDLLAIMMAHVSKPPPTLAEVAPQRELPTKLELIIHRGLEKVVADRFASAADYLARLDEVIAIDPRPSASYPTPAQESPFGFVATPSPTLQSQPYVAMTTEGAARVRRPTSIADAGEPIPRKWLVGVGFTIAGIVALALIAIASGERRVPEQRAASGQPSPSDPVVEAKQPEPTAPTGSVEQEKPDVDRDLALKALLHDLQTGKTCADRRAAIPKLVELGDARAARALKAARYRMRGGVLGIGAFNTNGCLKVDAEKAIMALTPPKEARP